MTSAQTGFAFAIIVSGVEISAVKSTYSIKDAQNRLPELVRRAEAGSMATITRHDKVVAHLLGKNELAALIETVEILANPAARAAIADAEAGRGRLWSLDEIEE
jgi:prevent-host-death family protein